MRLLLPFAMIFLGTLLAAALLALASAPTSAPARRPLARATAPVVVAGSAERPGVIVRAAH